MFSNKFVGKYMRFAKQIGEDENPCYSRKIGVVIVSPESNKILSVGYNGPPPEIPHGDSREYLEQVFWKQLTEDEKDRALEGTGYASLSLDDKERCKIICDKYENSKTCPRRIIGYSSGQGLDKCLCTHAEANAIVNRSNDLSGSAMFCWCPVPCRECSKLIIKAEIKKIYCLEKDKEYKGYNPFVSEWMLERAKIEVEEHSKEYYLNLRE